jgi:hypothetical protein
MAYNLPEHLNATFDSFTDWSKKDPLLGCATCLEHIIGGYLGCSYLTLT